MKTPSRFASLFTAALVQASEPTGQAFKGFAGPLEGTWTLVAADLLHPDGSRTNDYGASPSGRLTIDASGRYSVQIYKTERPRFASAEKSNGTAAEYEAAAMGSSAHFGVLVVDPVARLITMHLEHSAFPNWEGTTQARHYSLDGDVLSYQVPARADGNIPISVWRRLK